MPRALIDITSKKFGRLTVLKSVKSEKAAAKGRVQYDWLCRCECGAEKVIAVGNLRSGATSSCGCIRATTREQQLRRMRDWRANRKVNSPHKQMLASAKWRAKLCGVAFTITESDFEIPDTCPMLGIPLAISFGKAADNSPSLDRTIPSLGYVPGNVVVISHRANMFKRDATLAEARALVAYLERHQPTAPT